MDKLANLDVFTILKASLIFFVLLLVFLARKEYSMSVFHRILKWTSVYFVVIYLMIVAFRIHYPFQLSVWEGMTFDHCKRILSGHELLYWRPSLSFTPYIYTPLYFYVSSLFMKLLGIGLLAPRIISFLSSLGCFTLIYLIVNNETKERFPAILAVGLFAATFGINSPWFWREGLIDRYGHLNFGFGGVLDIADVDSLFILLLLSCLYIIRRFRSDYGPILAGFLLAVAFFTKQPAVFIAPFIALSYLVENRKYFVSFLAVFVSLTLSVSWFFNTLTNGWFYYYCFLKFKQLYLGMGPILRNKFLVYDLLQPFPIMIIIMLFFFFSQYKKFLSVNKDATSVRFYFFMTLAVIGASWFGRSHCGGDQNVMLPTYAIFAIVFGLGYQKIIDVVGVTPKNRIFRNSIYVLIITQFILLLYNPANKIPSANDELAGESLVRILKNYKGNVFTPWHNYLTWLAGKEPYATGSALLIVFQKGDFSYNCIYPGNELRQEIKDLIKQRYFDFIISDESPWLENGIKQVWEEPEWFDLVIDSEFFNRYYEPSQKLSTNDLVTFFPVTGWIIRPSTVYVPKGEDK